MASYKDLYTQAIESSLSELLGVISRYYEEEHGTAVSVDDLLEVLGATKAPTPVATKGAATRSAATKTAATKTAATKTATTTKAKAAPKADKERRSREQGQLPGLCLYVLTRGAHEGMYCTVRAVKGRDTCSSCKTKKGELGFYADDPNNGDEVDTGRAPGKFTGGVPEDDDDVPPLSVVPYGDSSVIYVTEDGSPTLLLVAGEGEGEGEDEGESFTVIGQLSSKNKIMPLNKLGVKRAQLLDLEVNMDMLAELQEKGLIEYNAADESNSPAKGEEVDTVPGLNVDEKPVNKKPNLPARKTATAAMAKPPPPRKPATAPAQRTARATIEVDGEDEE